jgi:HSP20 family molecular chaperone IbpA
MIKYDFEPFFTNEGKYFDTFTTTSTAIKDYFEKSYQYKDFKKQLQFAGFDKEEISVSYENDYLTVEGKSVMLDSDYTKKFYLPSKYYDVDKVSVKFEKCILSIECKLKEETQSKVMKIYIK